MLRAGACALGATVVLLAGCSSGTSASGPGAGRPAGAAPSGPCDRATFAMHAGLAGGAVHQLVWKPFQAGSFTSKAKGHEQAMTTGGRAGALASRELATALGVVKGCPSATTLVNALQTGVSLSASAGRQLSHGALNPATLGGANAIVTTVGSEAKALGITVTEQVPTTAQLNGAG